MTHRPYPRIARARRQVDRHAPAASAVAASPAVAEVLQSLTQMGKMMRQAYLRTNLHRAVIDLSPHGGAQAKPVITFQGPEPDATRHWNTTCDAPNYSDRCELPAGHEGRHRDGTMIWRQGVERPVSPASATS